VFNAGVVRGYAMLMALLVGCGAAFGQTNRPPDPQHVAEGKKLYEKHCIGCHQKDGVGEKDLPVGIRHPKFVPAMPLNDTSHAWHHSDVELRKTILKGLPDPWPMPGFENVITPQQAVLLVAYIKSLWSRETLACQGRRHIACMTRK